MRSIRWWRPQPVSACLTVAKPTIPRRSCPPRVSCTISTIDTSCSAPLGARDLRRPRPMHQRSADDAPQGTIRVRPPVARTRSHGISWASAVRQAASGATPTNSHDGRDRCRRARASGRERIGAGIGRGAAPRRQRRIQFLATTVGAPRWRVQQWRATHHGDRPHATMVAARRRNRAVRRCPGVCATVHQPSLRARAGHVHARGG